MLAFAQIIGAIVFGFVAAAVLGLVIAWALALVVLLGVPALWGAVKGLWR